MSAQLEFRSDAEEPLTSFNWGAIDASDFEQFQFICKNIGDQDATSVLIEELRLNQNDGIDFVLIAPDVGGNPGSYAASPLNVGTLAPNEEFPFWAKVTVPTGVNPGGNPRQFRIRAGYKGI